MTIHIAPLRETDLDAADHIFRLAFGTFLGLPDPLTFMGDADLVRTRWQAAPGATLGAYKDDRLIGSNFAARWGSFGFFGPLTVHPDHWDKGVGRRLVAATLDLFDLYGIAHRGLFTFPDSPKHIGLYSSFGFARQELTPVMVKPVARAMDAPSAARLFALPRSEQRTMLKEARALLDVIEPGLDLGREIEALEAQGLGDVIIVRDAQNRLAAFAICHEGAASEAGSGSVFVKFGAARRGSEGEKAFRGLLEACEAYAAEQGAEKLIAGVNKARASAHQMMVDAGFSVMLEGVAMQQDGRTGFNRPDCLVIDDWR